MFTLCHLSEIEFAPCKKKNLEIPSVISRFFDFEPSNIWLYKIDEVARLFGFFNSFSIIFIPVGIFLINTCLKKYNKFWKIFNTLKKTHHLPTKHHKSRTKKIILLKKNQQTTRTKQWLNLKFSLFFFSVEFASLHL